MRAGKAMLANRHSECVKNSQALSPVLDHSHYTLLHSMHPRIVHLQDFLKN